MITATFKIGKDDVLAMTLHYYASSPAVRKSRILTQASVPFAMLLVAVVGYFRDAGYGYLVLITPLLLIAVVWAVLYPWLHRQYLLQSAQTLLKESSYQKAYGAYTLSFSENGIADTSPIGEATYYWSAVNRVSLTPHYLFMFFAGPQGYPIARAQLPEDTIQKLKSFAEEMIRKAQLVDAERPTPTPPSPSSA